MNNSNIFLWTLDPPPSQIWRAMWKVPLFWLTNISIKASSCFGVVLLRFLFSTSARSETRTDKKMLQCVWNTVRCPIIAPFSPTVAKAVFIIMRKENAPTMLFFSENTKIGERWKWDECNAMILQCFSSYSNLTHHIHSKHEKHIKARKNASLVRKQLVSSSLSFPSQTRAAHAWIEAVVLCMQPFLLVQNRVMRKHSTHGSISVDWAMKYMHLLTRFVESRIGTMPPDKFCVMFDGWAGGDTH